MSSYVTPVSAAPTKSIRDAFGTELLKIAEQNENVVCLTADLAEAIRIQGFVEKYPERFVQMGVCESDMMGTAAGLALGGKIPIATTFAVFATSLANQPVRLSMAYNRTNAKIVASHGGVTVGPDGATHQAFEDFALMRMLPGMTVVIPGDAEELSKALPAIIAHDGPVYMRIGRVPTPVVTLPETPFELGKAVVLRPGSDVAILTTGTMVATGLEAAEELAAAGVEARVVHLATIKPLDEDAVLAAARECGGIVTVEEHSILGGLGGAVAETLAEKAPTPMRRVGVRDTFGESGEPDEILKKYGLTAADVVHSARELVRK